VARGLLQIAQQYSAALDVKSWLTVFETMQRVEIIVSERLQLNGQKKKDKLTFNADGVQQIINFEELKNRVHD
jgi:hypothetical protein